MKDKVSHLKSLCQCIATMTLSTVLIGAMITAMENGGADGGWWESLGATYASRGFWIGMMMPILVMIPLLYAFMPYLNRWLRGDRRFLPSMPAWHLNRLVVTICSLIFTLSVAAPITLHQLRGDRPIRTDQLLFTFILCLAYAVMTLYLWIRKPDPEKVKAFQTGDRSRVQDERYQAIVGKSAVSALYLILILLCVAGSLYDVLIIRTWPVRTLAEVIGILVIWQVSYNRWSKRL